MGRSKRNRSQRCYALADRKRAGEVAIATKGPAMSLGGTLRCPLGCPGPPSLKNRARYLFGANSLICERCGKESGVDSWNADAGLDYMLMHERIEGFLRSSSRPRAYCANCIG